MERTLYHVGENTPKCGINAKCRKQNCCTYPNYPNWGAIYNVINKRFHIVFQKILNYPVIIVYGICEAQPYQ